MTITRVKLENFTVFERLDLEPSPGINVLVGANGTGKTHLMKVCYAACDVSIAEKSLAGKLVSVFLPSGHTAERLGRLIKLGSETGRAGLEVFRGQSKIEAQFSKNNAHPFYPYTSATNDWSSSPIDSVYIPAKDMLANAPGFRSLYVAREIHFEETYQDILDKAYLPALRDSALDRESKAMLNAIEAELGGKVVLHGEEFFLSGEQGEIEFTLLAEGLRKLGLLWLLIRNGSLRPGAVLFWDEPETNLNPKLYGVVIDVLLELQRLGMQIFLATHDYVILRELDLQAQEGDKVAFHSLYHEEGQIRCHSTDKYLETHPNAIMEAFDSIYDREIKRSLPGPA